MNLERRNQLPTREWPTCLHLLCIESTKMLISTSELFKCTNPGVLSKLLLRFRAVLINLLMLMVESVIFEGADSLTDGFCSYSSSSTFSLSICA